MIGLAAPVVMVCDVAACWERARVRCGHKHEYLSAVAGIPATQLSAQLRGKGHPSLLRLLMLLANVETRAFVWAFFDELKAESGQQDDDALALLKRAEAALVRERRMAKATLTPHVADVKRIA